ncbi:MAG TPA: MFS transporter [Propionibacteriaceae bacterium]|nr:MFS transporter [Propionibacteriaceae bacterium]
MFLLALLAFFAIALPDAMLGVAWPFMRITFDQPLAAMTLVLPFGVAATIVSTSSWTWAAARLGLGRLLAGSLAMSTAALLISATAPAYWVVVACAVLFGLSAGAIDAALNAYAVQHFGPRRINFMHAAYGVGAATSPLVVTAVVSVGTSWRWAYLAVMVIQGLLTVLFAVTSRRWTAAAAGTVVTARATAPGSASVRGSWHRQRRAVAGLLVVVVEVGLESAVGLWAFVFLFEAMAVPAAAAGLVVSGYWAAMIVGRVLLGTLAERVGIWPVLATSAATVVVAAALLVTREPVPAAVGIVLLGLALAPVFPLLMLTTAERTPAGSVDRLVGYQAAASTVGSVTFGSAIGLAMGADPAAFGICTLVLALLSGGGIWALRPGRATPAKMRRAATEAGSRSGSSK